MPLFIVIVETAARLISVVESLASAPEYEISVFDPVSGLYVALS